MKKLLFPTLLLSVFILTVALHPIAAQDSTVVVSINISTSGDDMPIGAQVTLANDDGLPEHTYTAISLPDGIVVFSEVFIGTYDLSVDLFGYQPLPQQQHRHNTGFDTLCSSFGDSFPAPMLLG